MSVLKPVRVFVLCMAISLFLISRNSILTQAQTYRVEFTLEYVKEAAWSADGTRIVIAHNDALEVWNIASQQIEATLDIAVESDKQFSIIFQYDGELGDALQWSPDGKYIAAVLEGEDGEAGDKVIRVWDAERFTPLYTITNSDRAVSFSPNSKILASNYHLYDMANGKLIKTFTDGSQMVWSPDSKYHLSSYSGGIEVRNPDTGEVIRSFGTTNRSGMTLFWHDDEIIAINDFNCMYRFNALTGESLVNLSTSDAGYVDGESGNACEYVPFGQTVDFQFERGLIAGTTFSTTNSQSQVGVWNFSLTKTDDLEPVLPASYLKWSPDGSRLLALYYEFFDAETRVSHLIIWQNAN
ncbi:MAG: hypothetical protein KF726_14865 [Anaerolineae bacterium]|nr:hypothetical protein [Anaerolineae bacterium]